MTVLSPSAGRASLRASLRPRRVAPAVQGSTRALRYVRLHGVVLVSAHGDVPRLVDEIAGEPVRGSWWGHSEGRRIFAVLRDVAASPSVLVCRLLDRKLTLVHRRLWAPLVRVAGHRPARLLARVREEHTASGRHVVRVTAYPEWVPDAIWTAAAQLSARDALEALPEAVRIALRERAGRKQARIAARRRSGH